MNGRLAMACAGLGVLIGCALFAASAGAVPGDLDPSFSRDGFLRVDLGGTSSAEAVAVDARSRLVVAATSDADGRPRMSIVRLTDRGRLDRTFGRGGIAAIPADLGDDGGARTVTVLPDGDVLAGAAGDAGYTAARLNADGGLDPSFGGDGIVDVALGAPADLVAAVVAADGSVVLGGHTRTSNGAGTVALLARLTAAGALDPSFSEDGLAAFAFPDGDASQLAAIALPDPAHILVAGTRFTGNFGDFALGRLLADGSLDPTFSDDGSLVLERPYSQVASTMQLDSSGRILLAGCCSPGLLRLSPDGGSDPAFSLRGRGSYFYEVDLVGVDSAGRIVTAANVGGCYERGCSSPDYLVGRVEPDGLADPDFADEGIRWQDFAKHDEFVSGLAVLPDDRIVVAGQSARRLMVALYESKSGPPDADGDGDRDAHDRCPYRYDRAADGCPRFSRRLTFVRSPARDLFSGRLISRDDKCINGRTIEVRREERGFDRILKSVHTDPAGHWQMDAALTPGVYYALVDADFSKPIGRCRQARSDDVTIR